MATQQDLDTSLETLVSDVVALTAATAANSTAVAALLAKIANGTPPIDLSSEVAKVQSTDQAVKDAIAAITAADAPPAAA